MALKQMYFFTPIILLSVNLAPLTFAQGVYRVIPTKISPDSRALSIDPTLAGFRLGDPLNPAAKKLKKPKKIVIFKDKAISPVSWSNIDSTITLMGYPGKGIDDIEIRHRSAGSLDGISVGDTRESVINKWGPPASGGEIQEIWLAGPYIVSITFIPEGNVRSIGLGYGK